MDLQSKALLALDVDRAFSDYEIQLTSEEARTFAKLSAKSGTKIDEAVIVAIDLISAAMPVANLGKEYLGNARRPYTYRIGRKVSRRSLSIEIIKTNFPDKYEFHHLFKKLRTYSLEVGALIDFVDKDQVSSICFLWVIP